MPYDTPVIWQPISQMPLISSMIDTALDDTREHLSTLAEARSRPHVLDGVTTDRTERVHAEQLQFVGIYAEQIGRWRSEMPSEAQERELDRMEEQSRRFRSVTEDVLALAGELRKGTIERVMDMSDVELGIQALLEDQAPGRR